MITSIRFRAADDGKVILQVCERTETDRNYYGDCMSAKSEWRDAIVEDLIIDIEFSDEVGERTGSWKGGVLGCGFDMLPGERPVDALRRMELERKFT